MSKHTWVQENIETYIVGGLDSGERERFEQHVAECGDCAAALDDGRAFDRHVGGLFAAVQPDAALEDRMIRRLRFEPGRKQWRPAKSLLVVMGAAAAVLMAILGAGINSAIEDGGLPLPGTVSINNLKQIALFDESSSTFTTVGSTVGNTPPAKEDLGYKVAAGTPPPVDDPAKIARDLADRHLLRIPPLNTDGEPLVTNDIDPTSRGAGQELRYEEGKDYREPSVSAELNKVQMLSPPGVPAKPIVTVTPTIPWQDQDKDKIHDGRKSEEVIKAPLMQPEMPAKPTVTVAPVVPEPGRTMFAPAFTSPSMQWAAPSAPLPQPGGPAAAKPGTESTYYPAAGFSPDGTSTATGKSKVNLYAETGEKAPGKDQNRGFYYIPSRSEDENERKLTESFDYFRSAGEDKRTTGKLMEEGKSIPSLDDQVKRDKEHGDGPKSQVAQQDQTKQPEPNTGVKKEPPASQRKIIRSGEIEFEVKSFDDAVSVIGTLVRGTKGGFIATINSDKLPNGKVRGSVVIRVPPEELDDLVLELRKKLTEAGELKGQRIGSQDITKQYTDLESRLRAARTMEERLLKIIKEGKGEIKDLLQAEKELGVWRTKIEEMEGELRYYANQVSLSTLVINLEEKEIRTAAVITENERIQAGIEVEDVEKARDDALEAILKAGGRVSRSELKQHAAGQFAAVLNFEVAPEKTGEVRDRLRQLGNMVRLEIDRLQQTADGQPAPRDGKIKRGDTQFFVNIYNLANIAPREVVTMRIAAADVPEAYQKLREVIGTAKTRVANVQLNVQNAQNVTAQLDFDIRRNDDGSVQAALKNAGEILSRSVSRQPEGENVTDAKVGYRIELVNIVNIPPREIITLRLAASNVNQAYDKIREVVGKASGRVINLQLNVQDTQNVTAQLDFDVRRSDDGTVYAAIVAAGDIVTRHVSRQPDGDNFTDTRVGYRIQFISMISVPARETRTLRLAATKITDAHAELLQAVEKIKGHVTNDQLNVNDPQNVTAQLDFVIRAGDELAVEAAIKTAGEAVARQVVRQPEGENIANARIAYRIELVNVVTIPARETVTLRLAAPSVTEAYERLREAIGGKGRVLRAELNAQDEQNVTAQLDFDVNRGEDNDAIRKEVKDAGKVLSRQVSRQAEGQNVTDMRVAYRIELVNANSIAPRETVKLSVEVTDVEKEATQLSAQIKEAGGRVVSSDTTQERNGRSTAHVVYDVPLTVKADVMDRIKLAGQVRSQELTRNPQAPDGELALARVDVVFFNVDPLVPRDQSFWAQLRHGLSVSFYGLFASLSWLIAGVLFILPWLLLVLAVLWVVRRVWRTAPPESPSAPVS